MNDNMKISLILIVSVLFGLMVSLGAYVTIKTISKNNEIQSAKESDNAFTVSNESIEPKVMISMKNSKVYDNFTIVDSISETYPRLIRGNGNNKHEIKCNLPEYPSTELTDEIIALAGPYVFICMNAEAMAKDNFEATNQTYAKYGFCVIIESINQSIGLC